MDFFVTCDSWYHAGCEGVSLQMYKLLAKDDQDWFCKACKANLKGKLRKINRLEQENIQYKQENQILLNELQEWKEKFQAMKGEIIEEVSTKVVEAVNERLIDEVKNRVEIEIKERKKQRRKITLSYTM